MFHDLTLLSAIRAELLSRFLGRAEIATSEPFYRRGESYRVGGVRDIGKIENTMNLPRKFWPCIGDTSELLAEGKRRAPRTWTSAGQ